MNRAERRRAQRAGKTTNPLAISWYSNAMWAETGYGTQTRQAVTRLASDGHHVSVIANYGLAAMKTVYEGIPHYPMGVDAYSNDIVGPSCQDWARQHPDSTSLLIALFDAWPLKGPAWDRLPVGIWTMVDHFPVPPAVLAFLAKPNVTPLAASRFAHREIERAGVEALYVPMAIDTDLYRPTTQWDNGTQTLTGRQLMGFGDDGEDHFVVSCINANKSGSGIHRKAWGENLLAFKMFADSHDDARLYIHTERHGKYGGANLDALIAAIGLKPHQYAFVNQWALQTGIPNEAMAALYSATDVLLASTYGEGFGLTTVEAASCGTVSILNDFTCQPEMQAEGWLTTGQPWWDSHQGAWWSIPNVGSIVEALEAAYARGRHRSTAQRDHVLANYDADAVYENHWKPALEYLRDRAEGRHLTGAAPHSAPEQWTLNPEAQDPGLTIYIPTYRRHELGGLLASLAPQLTSQVEVIVSDNDADGTGFAHVVKYLADSNAHIEYMRQPENIGGDANILRGYTAGSAPWVWIVGDDDEVLPGAVENVLGAIARDDADRIILLTADAPRSAAGVLGPPAQIAEADPGLLIAATLISANVVRRSLVDVDWGRAHIETMYGHAWAYAASCKRVYVLPEPAIRVGKGYANEALASHPGVDPVAVWSDLLRESGVEPSPESFAWNFVSVGAQ